MPHFLTQADVPFAMRRPHLERFRRMLRESLHNPGLAPEQRGHIKKRLAGIGLPKIYGPSSSSSDPQEAAVERAPTDPPVQSLPDADALERMTKAELEAQAAREGVGGVSASNQRKAEMLETLLRGRE